MVAATLCLGAQAAHAQSSPVNYWIPGWPMGFSGAADESPDAYGNFPSFDFRDTGNGSSYARYNFSNGFFVGSQRSSMGFSGLSQSALGGFGSIYSEGVQFGYSLKNGGGPPVTFFAGFDTLKYNSGIGSNAFAPFDSKSGTLPVSSAFAGVEFQPTSNLSLSLGVGVVQQTGRIDSEINSLPGASRRPKSELRSSTPASGRGEARLRQLDLTKHHRPSSGGRPPRTTRRRAAN